MLTIRKEQIKVLEQSSLRDFHKWLTTHIIAHFPPQACYLGDQGILRIIEQGCANAKGYGFETERDLCLFTDLSIMLGIGFDTDPQLPWTAAILHDNTLGDPWYTMDKLWDKSMEYLVEVIGPIDVFPIRAYRSAMEHFPIDIPRSTPDSIIDMSIKLMVTIWPKKVEYIGTAQLHKFIKKSLYDAERHKISHRTDQIEFVIYAFLLGHYFYIDYLYPWAQDILKDKPTQDIFAMDKNAKIVHLRKAYKEWIDKLF